MNKFLFCLWFDSEAEEAANFYTSLFRDGEILERASFGEAGKELHGKEPGSVMTVDFEIGGMRFSALNGGPGFTKNPSISFFINCTSPEELDRFWDVLSKGGTVLMPLDSYPFSERYGWVQDRFGVSWQLILPGEAVQQKIVPSFLFTGEQSGRAEEAMRFYTSVFHDSRVGEIARYGDQADRMESLRPDWVMYEDFTLEGIRYAAMDGGLEHDFAFNEGISLIVDAPEQEEIDYYWNGLSANPDSGQCGWLKDRFGVSWQVFPVGEMNRLLMSRSREAAERVMEAMFAMKKIDIGELRRVAEG
jgi:predicted 3-demethylubiquinone-9 3-methyltransferase (glyoxalase superfamily)